MTTCILTILKAAENEKYNNFFETFNLHGPKCPNFRKILPHVLDLKMLPSLRNNQQLLYHSLWNTLYVFIFQQSWETNIKVGDNIKCSGQKYRINWDKTIKDTIIWGRWAPDKNFVTWHKSMYRMRGRATAIGPTGLRVL